MIVDSLCNFVLPRWDTQADVCRSDGDASFIAAF